VRARLSVDQQAAARFWKSHAPSSAVSVLCLTVRPASHKILGLTTSSIQPIAWTYEQAYTGMWNHFLANDGK
jgi:hypothetical protein